MATRTVKFFDSGKGFGFIQPESGDRDVFVHISAVHDAGMDTLTDGQRVSYDVRHRARQTGGQQPENCLTA